MRSEWLLGAIAAAALSGAACLPRGTDLSGRFAPSIHAPVLAKVDFAALKTNVLAPRCLRCHAEYGSEEGVLRDVAAGDPEHSALYRSIESGAMPPDGPRVPGDGLAIVRTYIEGIGQAPEPEPAPSPSPSPNPSGTPAPAVDFETLRARILTPSCVACHAEMDTAEGLTAYLVPGDPEHSPLYRAVVSGQMPPGGPAVEDPSFIRDYIRGLPAAVR